MNSFQVLGGEDGGSPRTVYDNVFEYDAGFEIWRNDSVVPKLNRPARLLTAVMVDSQAVNCS